MAAKMAQSGFRWPSKGSEPTRNYLLKSKHFDFVQKLTNYMSFLVKMAKILINC